jgi:hypothetical protein
MSMNHLGKGLVLATLALSVMLLVWAVGLFASPVDLGMKEPRRAWRDAAEPKGDQPNERLASQIDQRAAALRRQVEGRAQAEKRLPPAQKRLKAAEGKFAYNHQVYRNVMYYLAQSKDPKVEIKEVVYDKDGRLVLVPDAPWGFPAFSEKPLKGVTRSHAAYLAEVNDVQAQMDQAIKSSLEQLESLKKITVQLTGVRDEKGMVQTPGFYDLLEEEAKAQKALREEMQYLEPLWFQELSNAQLLRARREGLEKRLRELGEDPYKVVPPLK